MHCGCVLVEIFRGTEGFVTLLTSDKVHHGLVSQEGLGILKRNLADDTLEEMVLYPMALQLYQTTEIFSAFVAHELVSRRVVAM